MKSHSLAGLLLGGLLAIAAVADEPKAPKPSARDKCPVCGMFVSKYPDWVASLRFRDGSTVFFDGAKDLFKYYCNLAKYRPGGKTTDLQSIFLTDYYSLNPIDGSTAYYVMGSDVLGPMGKGAHSLCEGGGSPRIHERPPGEELVAVSGDHPGHPQRAGVMVVRKSDLFLRSLAFGFGLLVWLMIHGGFTAQDRLPSRRICREIVEKYDLTDLCLFTEARYTRNPAMADLMAPFQDHPMSLEHFPSGSLVAPPLRKRHDLD